MKYKYTGYRELNVGEVINRDDMVGNTRIDNTTDAPGELSMNALASSGSKYDPVTHYMGRYRKIEKVAKKAVKKPVVKAVKVDEPISLAKAYELMQKASGIEVGDIVKVVSKAESLSMGWQNIWTDGMDKFVGNECEVESIVDAGLRLRLSYSSVTWTFPVFVLKLVSKKPQNESIVLNAAHTAVCSSAGIKVGCQDFSWDIVDKLVEAKKRWVK